MIFLYLFYYDDKIVIDSCKNMDFVKIYTL